MGGRVVPLISMHILMTFPYSIGTPGGGTYAFLQTARHLKSAGADVTVIFLQSGGLKLFLRKPVPPTKASTKPVHYLQEAGLNVISVPVNRLSYALDSFHMKNAVADFIKRNPVDVIISWHHEAALLSNIYKDHKIPFIFRASGNYNLIANNERGKIWSAVTTHLLKLAITKADAVWAPSQFTRSEVVEFFNLDPNLASVIPEGFNPKFLQVNRGKNENQPITRFLFFGMWTESKGITDALNAFGKVAAQGIQDWQFHIAGWGNIEIIQRAIQANNLMDRVEILGKLDHQCLIEQLEWAQVAVLPSKIESFGLAIAEAQAAGVPVVAYETSAVPEMIINGVTGWLAPLNQVDSLVNAIIEAISDPAQTYCMGLAGRENIRRRFSWPATVKQMLTEIERLINLQ